MVVDNEQIMGDPRICETAVKSRIVPCTTEACTFICAQQFAETAVGTCLTKYWDKCFCTYPC